MFKLIMLKYRSIGNNWNTIELENGRASLLAITSRIKKIKNVPLKITMLMSMKWNFV